MLRYEPSLNCRKFQIHTKNGEVVRIYHWREKQNTVDKNQVLHLQVVGAYFKIKVILEGLLCYHLWCARTRYI